jgi:type IV pilus assembly protein PilY1
MKNTIVITLCLCLKLLQPSTVQAEFLDLATMPLQTSGSSDVKPNLMFILDNSGSMGFDYTPDWADSSSLWLFDNSSYNTQYYNPGVTYIPAMTAQNVSMGNQTNFRAVKRDVTATGAAKGGSVNLTSSADYYYYAPGEYCTTAALTSCIPSTQATATHSFPAEVRWCDSEPASKAATLSGSQNCKGIREGSYTWHRQPKATYRLTVNSVSGSVFVTSIKVNNVELLSGNTLSSNSVNGLATLIRTAAAASVNIFTGVGNGICTSDRYRNCQVFGNSVGGSGSFVDLSTVAGDAINTSNPVQITLGGTGSASISVQKRTGISTDVPGSLVYVKITDTIDSYPLPGRSGKGLERTDCVGTTCNYEEEMTNFSNWYTYYRTRMQAMKTATSQAFNTLDSRYRVGFMTINDPSNNYLNIAPFNTTQKGDWYVKLFATTASGGTPLRDALSIAGRHFAGKRTDIGSKDPMEYACQQNFALLTTDGYWNGATGVDIGGRNVGNLDSGSTPRPQYDSANASGSLADVAKYYYDTDIRDGGFSNCSGALGSSVCGTVDDYPKQNMVTLTLGLGIDGTLVYSEDYKTQAVGDFRDLRTGSKNWPNPMPTENGTRIDDLWHAAVNAGGTYYSAKNPKLLRESLAKGLSEIKSVQGASAAAAASSLAPTSGDNYQYVASYQTVKWIGNLEARTVNLETLETSETTV